MALRLAVIYHGLSSLIQMDKMALMYVVINASFVCTHPVGLDGSV